MTKRCKCGDRLFPEDGDCCPFCINNPDMTDPATPLFAWLLALAVAALLAPALWHMAAALS